MTSISESDLVGIPEDLTELPAWLVQYSPRSAHGLRRRWNEGEDTEDPAVDRHLGDIGLDHIILFWVSGHAKRAGIIGWGITSGLVRELDHAKSYHDPDGPRAQRTSAEVEVCEVFDTPIITRHELKKLPEFGGFELFRMPNRSNAFAVTRQQWAIILDRIEMVMGV